MYGLDASEVQNCSFAKRCSKTWGDLSPIEGERAVRFCNECRELVHLCRTAAQVKANAERRHCVAIKISGSTEMMVGDIGHYG